MRRVTTTVALALCLLGCGGTRGLIQTPRGAVIDGWPVGAEFDCAVIDGCDGLIHVAMDRLAARDSFRPKFSSATLYQYRQDEDGIFRSGGAPVIAVFKMTDGSLEAIGVKRYPGGIPP